MTQKDKQGLDLTTRSSYTRDQLLQKFGNQFDLVNYAIKLAENLIKTGRAPRISISSENPALLVIAEIASGKDQFEEIVEAKEETMTFFTPSETARQTGMKDLTNGAAKEPKRQRATSSR